jgi:ligand-binding sensor domain-containing protein
MIKRFLPLLLILAMPACLYGFEWQTFTNSNSVTSLASGNDQYWAATTGGVLNFNPATGNIIKYVNTDGLGGTNINDVAYGNSYFWFGSTDGRLSRFDPGQNSWKQFLFVDRDGSPLNISRLYPDGTELWVATNIGISLFDTERHGGEIKETYRRFGNIPAGNGVSGMLILNDTVWVATARGLAYALKSDPNLLDYTHWHSVTLNDLPDLPSEDFQNIFIYQGMIYGALPRDLIGISIDAGVAQIANSIHTPNTVRSIAVSNDTIYIGSNAGSIYSWSGGVMNTEELPFGPDSAITAMLRDDSYGLILGTEFQGLFVFQGREWTNFTTTGPANNMMIDGATTSDGRVWLAEGGGWVSSFDSEGWQSFLLPYNSLLSLEADNQDNVWVGTFGGGVFEITESSVLTYDMNNSSLIGNNDNLPSSLNFIVVYDMFFDHNDVMWFGCYRGHVKRPISFLDEQTDSWDYYTYDGFNLEAKIISIYSDGNDVWAGFEDAGLYQINYGDDPFNPADLTFKHYTRDSLLPSENVRIITADNKGQIVVGTDMGLAFKNPDERFFSRIVLPEGIGPQINDILFDDRNNMWVATRTGLALREAGATNIMAFTTANSDLIDDNVLALTLDGQRRLWALTGSGISMLTYDIGTVTDNSEEVYAYPNPFILSDGNEKVEFNYLGEVPIEIFSLDGRKIKTILSNVGWDGTNESGEKVASGLYLFFIRDENGNTYTGKIALIRK